MNRSKYERLICGVIEVGILLLLVLAPWPFGSLRALPLAILYTGIAILLVLWAIRLCLMEAPTFQVDTGLLCLTGLFLFNLFQTIPLPDSILAIISPRTNELRRELLPQTPERLHGDTQAIPVPDPGKAQPLSVNPRVTKSLAIPLFAIFLVYALVRNNLSNLKSRERFAWTAALLGLVLSCFAFVQALSMDPKKVQMYWTFDFNDSSIPFGPFVNRDHFSFFIHFCIGSAVGLLLLSLDVKTGSRRKRTWLDLFNILQKPRALWMLFSLVMMIIASAYSLSRGGMLSIAAALFFASLVWWRRTSDRTQIWTLLAVVPIVVFGLLWLGADEVIARLGTLTNKQELANSRGEIWRTFWPLVPEFPVAGTGGRTSSFVEGLHKRVPVEENIWNMLSAHNEYLESLVEGGIIRLALLLVLLGFLFRHGMRVVRSKDRNERGLALGLLAGLVGVAMHAFVDFGLNTPAIALMVTVASAHLASTGPPRRPPIVLPRWGAVLAAILLAASAIWLTMMGWHEEQVYRYSRAAERVMETKDAGRWDVQIQYREAAVELEPDNAVLRQSLAEAYVDAYEEGRKERNLEVSSVRAAGLIAAGFSLKPCLADLAIASEMPRIAAWPEEQAARQKYLRPGLYQWVVSRNLCPLLPQAHTAIASYHWMFAAADPELRYLDRAILVFPGDPRLWYARGRVHLQEGKPDEAWHDWRESLTRSMKLLPEILLRARAAKLTDQEIIDKVLPPKTEALMKAADILYPNPAAAPEQRRPFMEKALALLPPTTTDNGTARIRAVLLHSLGNREGAEKQYKEAITEEPDNWELHYKYAILLYEMKNWKDAESELRIFTTRDPGNPKKKEALELLRKVQEHNQNRLN